VPAAFSSHTSFSQNGSQPSSDAKDFGNAGCSRLFVFDMTAHHVQHAQDGSMKKERDHA
jgi:hypothetical protein